MKMFAGIVVFATTATLMTGSGIAPFMLTLGVLSLAWVILTDGAV